MQRKGKEVSEEDRLYRQDKATKVAAAKAKNCFTDCGPTVHSMLFEPSMLLSRMCAAK